MSGINIARIRQAARSLNVEGVCGSSPERRLVIEDAIAAIQRDGKAALDKQYMAVKNYADFGDQREDHAYGLGPAHGHVVFSVGRTGLARTGVTLGADHVYLLECARDFPGVPALSRVATHDLTQRRLSLTEAIAQLDQLHEQAASILKAIESVSVVTHG